MPARMVLLLFYDIDGIPRFMMGLYRSLAITYFLVVWVLSLSVWLSDRVSSVSLSIHPCLYLVAFHLPCISGCISFHLFFVCFSLTLGLVSVATSSVHDVLQ